MIKAQNAKAAAPDVDGQYPTSPTSLPSARGHGFAPWRPVASWLFSRRHRSTLGSCAAQLRAHADSLSGHAAATEPEFLALGGDLRTLYDSATSLSQSVDAATTRLHADLTANRIGGADGAVAQSLHAVNDSISAIDRMLSRLRTMTDGLLSMKPQMERISRVGVLLQSVAVGFAVESSRTAECQQAFGSFVDEIRGLSRRTREVEQHIGEELERASAQEIAALRALEQELVSLRDLSRQLEITSSRTAAEVQARMNDIVAAMAAMRDCSIQIQRHTEDAVFHMQFGDIVRQKIEHTVDALHDAAAQLTAHNCTASTLSAVPRTIAVQSAQIELVETELATAQRQLEQAFSQIADSSASLITPDDRSSSTEHSGTVGLRPLLEDLDQLQGLVGRGGQLRQRADDSGREAFVTAERIASQMSEVRSINREMHLLALNAIVKTAALGATGATLEVLSMQVHTLYLEADAAVREIDTLAQQLTGAQEQNRLAAVGSTESSLDLSGIVEQVRRAAADYSSTTTALGKQSVANREQLDKATARLDSLDQFARQLRSLREGIDTERATLTRSLGRALSQAPIPAVHDDDNRYTMQSEREVHRRIDAARVAPASVPAAPVQPATPPAPPTATPQPETTKAAAAPSDTPGTGAPVPTAAPQSFGDNVELF